MGNKASTGWIATSNNRDDLLAELHRRTIRVQRLQQYLARAQRQLFHAQTFFDPHGSEEDSNAADNNAERDGELRRRIASFQQEILSNEDRILAIQRKLNQ